MSGSDPRAGQQAARLLAAAQDWLRTSAPDLAPASPEGQPCSCPLCRAVVGLRDVDPESVGRWVDSAVAGFGSLAAQAGDLVAAAAERAGGDATGPNTGTDDLDRDAEQRPARQDEAAPRSVRRIPLEPTDDPERQPR